MLKHLLLPEERDMKVKLGDIPPEANLKGGLNESTPVEQRKPDAPQKDLDEGPKRGSKDEYLPASYVLRSGTIRTDR